MGYRHIDNLYNDTRIFTFDECYALEKIHGTSAHVKFKATDVGPVITLFSGGEPMTKFSELFDMVALRAKATNLTLTEEAVFYGEAYGGKQQGMRETYGDQLKFVVFDVLVDGKWLNVEDAHALAEVMGFEFVDYVKIPTKLHLLNAERDKPSVQAKRNGIEVDRQREGIVIRPVVESYDHRGNRIMSKHKSASFCETKTVREVDPEKQQRIDAASKIAEEWVTENRLDHVLDQARVLKRQVTDDAGLPEEELGITDTGCIVKLMVADVERESAGLTEPISEDVRKQIGSAAARLWKKRLASSIKETV